MHYFPCLENRHFQTLLTLNLCIIISNDDHFYVLLQAENHYLKLARKVTICIALLPTENLYFHMLHLTVLCT